MEFTTPGTFARFPFLPSEIRFQIWAEASRIPRVIRIKDRDDLGDREVSLEGNIWPLLLVCKESREQILRIRERNGGRVEGDGRLKLRCNVERDIIWLEDVDTPFVAWTRSLIWNTSPKLLLPKSPSLSISHSLQHLAVPYRTYPLLKYTTSLSLPWLMNLQLASLSLVINNLPPSTIKSTEPSSSSASEQEIIFQTPNSSVNSEICAIVLQALYPPKTCRTGCGNERGHPESWGEIAEWVMGDLEGVRERFLREERIGSLGAWNIDVDLAEWEVPTIRFVEAISSE